MPGDHERVALAQEVQEDLQLGAGASFGAGLFSDRIV